MNYSEKYEVRMRTDISDGWVVLNTFDREHQADEYMLGMAIGSGVWRVVRVSEVTVGSVSKS